MEPKLFDTGTLRCTLCMRLIPSAVDMDGDEYGAEWVPTMMAGKEPVAIICLRCIAVLEWQAQ
jgi:hypothetical protein